LLALRSISRIPLLLFPRSRSVEQNKHRNPKTGILTTSLPEDVFSLLHSDAGVLDDIVFHKSNLPEDSNTSVALWVDGMLHVLTVLKQAQLQNRLLFVTTLFDTCAAANDFLRMSEAMEVFLKELTIRHAFLTLGENNLLVSKLLLLGNSLVATFSQDAVMAAERTQVFIMRDIQQTTSIASDFFSSNWEEEWTSNEVALSMIEFFDDYLAKIARYLSSDYLYQKAVIVAQKAMVCFYVRCLVNKADSVTRRRRNRERIRLPGEKHPFRNHERALRRMSDDINLMKECFRDKVDGNGTLLRILADDIAILDLVLECLGSSDSGSLESFIVVIHKRTGADPLVTRFFVGDLWTLTTDQIGRKVVTQTMKDLQPDLHMVTTRMKELSAQEEEDLSFVRMDFMLKAMYEDRVAQGILPACWACLPKIESDGNEEVVVKQIRTFTRSVVEMKWVKKHVHRKKNASF